MRLDYQRGAGAQYCPPAEALRSAVADELGGDPFTEADPWQLRVAIVRQKNGLFSATGEFFDGDGAAWHKMGEMVNASCRNLITKDVALWVAVELTDPLLPCPELPPSPAASPSSSIICPAPALPPLAAVPPAAPALPPPSKNPPEHWLRLEMDAGAEIGVRPTLTPRLALNAGFQVISKPLILSIAFDLRANLPLPGVKESGVIFSGAALGCIHFIRKGLFFVCPMIVTGAPVVGASSEVASVSGVYTATGARFGVAPPIASDRFAVSLALDILGTLHPIRWTFDDRQVGADRALHVRLPGRRLGFFLTMSLFGTDLTGEPGKLPLRGRHRGHDV